MRRIKGFKYFVMLVGLYLSTATHSFASEGSELPNGGQLDNFELMMYSGVTVASIKALDIRESPGIVTVIKADEIASSGARDLIDLLRLVPGIEFGFDVQGYVSIGVRGIWATEGKVALMLDGQEMNEPLYGTFQLGNHFSVDQIKQIELIRGPGSSIHGGYAELAVINIVTKGAEEIKGLAASVVYGQMDRTYARRNLSLTYADKFGPDFSVKGSMFLGQGNRSDRDFTDFYGSAFSMAENARLDPLNLDLQLDYKGAKALLMIDRMSTTQRDEFGEDLQKAVSVEYNYSFFELNYDYKLSDALTLTPKFNFKRQTPFKEPAVDTGVENLVYDKTVDRYTEGIRLLYDITEKTNVLGGIVLTQDMARDELEGSDSFDGNAEVYYSKFTGYLQGLIDNPIAMLTLGARYENHSAYGDSFVPRVALTKILGDWSFKLLGSKAFRAPTIENIRLNSEIKPENTVIWEAEAGYRLSSQVEVVGNVFDVTVDRPIIYLFDEDTGDEAYVNYDAIHTRGFELETRLKGQWGSLMMNYSYYRKIVNNVDLYDVSENSNALLGFPTHKVTLNSSLKINDQFSVNPSLVFLSDRYGYQGGDENDVSVLKRYDAVVLANLYLYYQNAFKSRLNIGLGVYNLLDAKYDYIQPYDGGHPPLPGPSREVMLKVSYNY